MLLLAAIAIFLITITIASIIRMKIDKDNEKDEESIMSKLNKNVAVRNLGEKMTTSNLEKIFDRAKNPWNMSTSTFQFIRFGGFLVFFIISITIFISGSNKEWGVFMLGIAVLFFWYPMYYYKAIGEEREVEWNKMYEFIWVLKNNLSMYDPKKSFIETKMYIEKHAPKNKEIIQGFSDFYEYYSDENISEKIKKDYPFAIPKEINQIVFNMSKTGEYPEDSLNSLRKSIINLKGLAVENTLSKVAPSATMYALPFLMASAILSLMVPLLIQFSRFM